MSNTGKLFSEAVVTSVDAIAKACDHNTTVMKAVASAALDIVLDIDERTQCRVAERESRTHKSPETVQ